MFLTNEEIKELSSDDRIFITSPQAKIDVGKERVDMNVNEGVFYFMNTNDNLLSLQLTQWGVMPSPLVNAVQKSTKFDPLGN